MLLHVQAVLQTQRQKLFLAQLAADAPRDLVAKLRPALAHQGAVVVVVLVHGPPRQNGSPAARCLQRADRVPATMAGRRSTKQPQGNPKKTDQIGRKSVAALAAG